MFPCSFLSKFYKKFSKWLQGQYQPLESLWKNVFDRSVVLLTLSPLINKAAAIIAHRPHPLTSSICHYNDSPLLFYFFSAEQLLFFFDFLSLSPSCIYIHPDHVWGTEEPTKILHLNMSDNGTQKACSNSEHCILLLGGSGQVGIRTGKW